MSSTSISIRRALAVAAAAGLIGVGSLGTAAAASAADSHGSTTVSAFAGTHRNDDDHAVFALTDDPTGNGVIAFDRNADGSLTRGSTYSTGGLGARVPGAVVDPLASQGALTYDRANGLLLAVNGGSDTLTVFTVDGTHLRRLQVLSTRGTLPVSVSVQGDVVYVLNAGGDASVAGFRVEDRRLHPIQDSVRTLALGNPAAPNFLKAPAQVAITPDGRHVAVTTKTNGTVVVWNLTHSGRPSAVPTVTTVGAVPFALDFDRAGDLLLVNAAGTLSSWSVAADGSLVSISGPVADFGKAACWLTTSGRFAYVANAGSSTISGFSIGATGSLALLSPNGISATTGPGPIDLAAAGDTLYVENGGNGSISSYRIAQDGSLTPLSTVTGLTADGGTGIEGIVAI